MSIVGDDKRHQRILSLYLADNVNKANRHSMVFSDGKSHDSYVVDVGTGVRQMQKEEELLKVQDVAARLHVNTRTVLRMVDRGELDAVKVARSWRFRPHDIDTYLHKHHTGSTSRFTIREQEDDLADDETWPGLADMEQPHQRGAERKGPVRSMTHLDLEKQRLELEKEQLELDQRRINYVLETTQKMVSMPDIDDQTKAKLLETLLPRLLELGNGRSLERNLPAPKPGTVDSRLALERERA